jgi:hypothetical protein
VFVPGKPFQATQVGEARSIPYCEAPERCCPWVGSGLTHKHQTRLERLARDNHSKLVQKFVNYGHKKFYRIGPWFEKILIGSSKFFLKSQRRNEVDFFSKKKDLSRTVFFTCLISLVLSSTLRQVRVVTKFKYPELLVNTFQDDLRQYPILTVQYQDSKVSENYH